MANITIQALTHSVLATFMFVIAANTFSKDTTENIDLVTPKYEKTKDYTYFKERTSNSEILKFISHIPETALSNLDLRKINELRCIALNNYYEAATEGVRGMQAVTQVVMNRMGAEGYPGTACGVIYQKSQFSWTAQRSKPYLDFESQAWKHSVKVATQMYVYGHTFRGLETALFYHAIYVSPNWKGVIELKKVGAHIFYGKKYLPS